MKFEQIVEFIEKAGFKFVDKGVGFGVMEGRPSHLYQKKLDGSEFQLIQLSTAKDNPEDIQVVYKNVPDSVRHAVNKILLDKTTQLDLEGGVDDMRIGF